MEKAAMKKQMSIPLEKPNAKNCFCMTVSTFLLSGSLFVGSVLAQASQSASPAIAKKNAVLEPVTNIEQLLPPEAVQRPHILFVNVGKALPDKDFNDAAAYVRMKYLFNVFVRKEQASFVWDVLKSTDILRQRFGDKAVIVVAVVKQEQGPSFINIPGLFAQLNIRGLDKDKPSALFLTKRYRQMFLKGLAHACGVGATLDPMCVMNYDSFTLEGMDSVSTTYGPNAHFGIRELLKSIGGPDIYAPW